MSRNDEIIWRIHNESLYLNDSEFDLFIGVLRGSNVSTDALDELIKNTVDKKRKIADISNRF